MVDKGLWVDFCVLYTNIRFEINDGNMKDLAHLSDKYIIDALQKDIRVCLLLKRVPDELRIMCCGLYCGKMIQRSNSGNSRHAIPFMNWKSIAGLIQPFYQAFIRQSMIRKRESNTLEATANYLLQC